MTQAERDRKIAFERAAAERLPHRELVRTEHYVEGNVPGHRRHGVRFHYADGTVADFPPHKLSAGGSV